MEENHKNNIIDKLIYELKLHDSDIIGLMITNDELMVEISCERMNVNYYYPDFDNVIFKINCKKTIKTVIAFHYKIVINDFAIKCENDKYVLTTDNADFYVECSKISVECQCIKNYNKHYKKLDDFLKSNI